ncbi:unnamed protein product [Symbiodinium sp. CCMP2592]|nr:unnamed protein product [Symbiodinium sp. CCMP2592]
MAVSYRSNFVAARASSVREVQTLSIDELEELAEKLAAAVKEDEANKGGQECKGSTPPRDLAAQVHQETNLNQEQGLAAEELEPSESPRPTGSLFPSQLGHGGISQMPPRNSPGSTRPSSPSPEGLSTSTIPEEQNDEVCSICTYDWEDFCDGSSEHASAEPHPRGPSEEVAAPSWDPFAAFLPQQEGSLFPSQLGHGGSSQMPPRNSPGSTRPSSPSPEGLSTSTIPEEQNDEVCSICTYDWEDFCDGSSEHASAEPHPRGPSEEVAAPSWDPFAAFLPQQEGAPWDGFHSAATSTGSYVPAWANFPFGGHADSMFVFWMVPVCLPACVSMVPPPPFLPPR